MKYNLEVEKAVSNIQSAYANKVLIQLPDGLKPQAKEIKDRIEAETSAEALIWLGSCFGACDIPYYTEKMGVDMIIQWGHSQITQETEPEPVEQQTEPEKDENEDTPNYGIPW